MENRKRDQGAEEPDVVYGMQARLDGRIEVVCPHGIGHYSTILTVQAGRRDEDEWSSVHGCDGCCLTEAWAAAEAKFSQGIVERGGKL